MEIPAKSRKQPTITSVDRRFVECVSVCRGTHQVRRREFVKNVCSLACATFIYGRRLGATPRKRLLVIGGTDFVGPAVVEAGVIAGYQVALFNRGVTNPGLFPTLEHIRGYRSADAKDQGFSGLAGRTWDAAVDVWPSDPVMVQTMAEFLRGRVGHYLFVSSGAAYQNFGQPGINENDALRPFRAGVPNYSDGKAESERRLNAIFGPKLTIVRPCSIDGYRNDGANLQTWLTRFQRGGSRIAPGTGKELTQFIDTKDVGRFLAHAIERSLLGAFNVVGEPEPFRDFIEACKSATDSSLELVSVPEDFLREQDADYARFFPFWQNRTLPEGFYQMNGAKARKTGWRCRAFSETAADTLQWYREREGMLPTANGNAGHWQDPLSETREAEIIRRWRTRQG